MSSRICRASLSCSSSWAVTGRLHAVVHAAVCSAASRGSSLTSSFVVSVLPSAVSLSVYVPGLTSGADLRIAAVHLRLLDDFRSLVAQVPDDAVQPRLDRQRLLLLFLLRIVAFFLVHSFSPSLPPPSCSSVCGRGCPCRRGFPASPRRPASSGSSAGSPPPAGCRTCRPAPRPRTIRNSGNGTPAAPGTGAASFASTAGPMFAQRRQVVEDPQRPAVRGDHQIVVLHHQIGDGHGREIQLQVLPRRPVVGREGDAVLRAEVEHALLLRVLAHRPQINVLRQLRRQAGPRLAAVGRLEQVRLACRPAGGRPPRRRPSPRRRATARCSRPSPTPAGP